MDYLIVKTYGVLEIEDYHEIDNLLNEHNEYSYDSTIDLIMAGFPVDMIKTCITDGIPSTSAIALFRYKSTGMKD